MFTFSKSLIESIADKADSDAKHRIERFIFYSGIYLQFLAFFIIFQLLKIIVFKYQIWINLCYIVIICIYIWVEDFPKQNQEENKTIILCVSLVFGLIPITSFIRH